MDAQFWDERYRSRDQLFSGRPNGVLVTEIADLPLGQALDVGCGAGADAGWLAALDGDWTVVVDETRRRADPAPAGTGHTHDVVMRAQRGR